MKKLLITASLLVISITTYAQSAMHLYHMKNETFVGQELNAAYFPDAKFYITLPFLPNLGVNVGTPISYDDIFTKTGDSTRVDISKILDNAKDFHSIDASTSYAILGFGFRLNDHSTFSFFSNAKSSISVGVPYDAVRLAWEGNGAFIGEDYEIDDLRLSALTYAEVGVGYSRDIEIVGQKATIGVRMKYLAGVTSAKIDNNAKATLTVDESTYRNTLAIEDASFTVGGFDVYEEEEGYISGNSGFAIDLGGSYEFNEKLTFSFALNDLGAITWKKAASEINVKGGEIVFEGVDLNNIDDLGDALSDQIDSLTQVDTTSTKFSTPLKSTLYMGAEYKLSDNGTAFATYSNFFSLGRIRTAFGVGYTHKVGKVLTVSGTIARTPGFGLDLGAGMSLRLGAVHLHFSSGSIGSLINLKKSRGVNANFGLNLIFGRPNKG